MKSLKIFSCSNSAEKFTDDICSYLKIKKGSITSIKFKNDNNFVQINESVRDKDVFLIQSTEPPVNERIMELLITIDAVKRASAKRITVVLPYYIYSRSDKKDQSRVPVTAKLFAQLIEAAGANRVLTCDLHNQAIQAYFNINCDVLTAENILEEYFDKKNIEDKVVVATDAGSSKKAYKYAMHFKCPIALIDKRRNGNSDTVSVSNVIGEIKDKNAIIFDDEVDTAGSIIETVNAIKKHGAKDIYVGCTHGILSANAVEKIKKSDIKEFVITDTVPLTPEKNIDKIKVVTITKLFAEAIRIIHLEKSIGELFERG